MSAENKKLPIEQAEEIIEKFGGIRPMAAKTNVAVTTVQGWKKRGVIPAARKGVLIKAANEHGIDLSNFFEEAPEVAVAGAEEGAKIEEVEDVHVEVQSVAPVDDVAGVEEKFEIDIPKSLATSEREDEVETVQASYTQLSVESERGGMVKAVAVVAVLLLLVLGALAAFFWPRYYGDGAREARLGALEQELYEIESNLRVEEEEQSNFKGLVSEDWSQQLEEMKRQTQLAGSYAAERAGAAANYVREEAQLDQRMERLQSYVSEVARANGLYAALMPRFDAMRGNAQGEESLDESVEALILVFKDAQGKDDAYLNAALDSARSKNAALQESLGNVPKTELKAAAMLLAMTQMRAALNRPDESFDSDLQLLMNMVGEEDVALRSSLEKIAPYSKNGILSAGGLRQEFQGITGEVVAASLRGEDVSFSEKLSARFNEILQVEKDGELLTGTQTQATVQKAQTMFNAGNWEEALRFLKKHLRAKELEPLRPWIRQVEAALNVRKVQKAIEQAIELNFGDGLLGGSELLGEE